ncbi:hypothetical protein ABZ342_16920 [Amycolatopsis sp. NPDC005961]|uniref:hypothetical protein n=1 Tax=Amycolatopsis sp. NPDC005961 TaxID=3156720 RepID=UPI0033E1E378
MPGDLLASEEIALVEWGGPARCSDELAEIVFVSDLAGTGCEWPTTTGLDDVVTLRTLRGIQRKLGKVVRAYYGKRRSEARQKRSGG